MIGATIGCGVGMFGYGHFVQQGASAYVCALFQGIMMCGVLIGTIAPVSYALDAYREASNEIFIMNMFLKNFLFYGISYVANDWVARDGPFVVLAACGGSSVAIVCSLLFSRVHWLIVVCLGFTGLYFRKEVAQLLDET
jgi:hypothetical protein